jgi:hypothetical protein
MKKLVLTYIITGLAGLAFSAIPVQAKDRSMAKAPTRQLAKAQSKVQVAAVSMSASPIISESESFRNDHPAGGN